MTLAKAAYQAHPELFNSVEHARSSLRQLLGIRGKLCRDRSDKTFYREPRTAGWQQEIPESLVSGEWHAKQFDGPFNSLVLSDIHVPYHDQKAVEVAIEYGINHDANFILINGDAVDNYSISRWETDPRERNYAREINLTKQFLRTVNLAFPNAVKVYKAGNHEHRLFRYLALKAPDLLGLPQFDWKELYGLNEYGFQSVEENIPIRLGDLNVLHGHEYKFAIQNPVNPARGLFLRTKAHALCSHFHQSSEHSENSVEGNVISCWSIGCLCDLHPRWLSLNKWNLGFAMVQIDESGAFFVQSKRIIDYKAY